jgi:acyl carrier protein
VTQQEFFELIGKEFGFEQIQESSKITTDLGLDSLDLLDLVVFVDELAGVGVQPATDFPMLSTMHDLWDYFEDIAGHSS